MINGGSSEFADLRPEVSAEYLSGTYLTCNEQYWRMTVGIRIILG